MLFAPFLRLTGPGNARPATTFRIWNEWVENDDTGKLRAVIIGSMCGGRYELYEDHEFLGCTHDVVSAAQFIAEGWEAYE